jgi:hypothetical protein
MVALSLFVSFTRFLIVSFVLFLLPCLLIHIWIAFKRFKTLFLSAFLTIFPKTVFGPRLFAKVLMIFRFERSTGATLLLCVGCFNYAGGITGDLLKRLSVECVKIECALSDVLRYTIVHNGNQHFLLSRLQVLLAPWGQKHGQFDLINYSINPPVEQLYGLFGMLSKHAYQGE